jgi:hypothetical protein
MTGIGREGWDDGHNRIWSFDILPEAPGVENMITFGFPFSIVVVQTVVGQLGELGAMHGVGFV